MPALGPQRPLGQARLGVAAALGAKEETEAEEDAVATPPFVASAPDPEDRERHDCAGGSWRATGKGRDRLPRRPVARTEPSRLERCLEVPAVACPAFYCPCAATESVFPLACSSGPHKPQHAHFFIGRVSVNAYGVAQCTHNVTPPQAVAARTAHHL